MDEAIARDDMRHPLACRDDAPRMGQLPMSCASLAWAVHWERQIPCASVQIFDLPT
jgi:hypothetical protein